MKEWFACCLQEDFIWNNQHAFGKYKATVLKESTSVPETQNDDNLSIPSTHNKCLIGCLFETTPVSCWSLLSVWDNMCLLLKPIVCWFLNKKRTSVAVGYLTVTLTMEMSSCGLSVLELVLTLDIFCTTSIPFDTRPKTVCFRSNQGYTHTRRYRNDAKIDAG